MSESEITRRATRQFESSWLTDLEKIRSQLQHGAFSFRGERGLAPQKANGTGVRPLVVAPIPNRVVRRAILEVLQGYGAQDDGPRHRWDGVPAIRAVMATPTSVGGVAERGVPHGLALIDHAVRAKKHWFVRSDIRNFFTRIPKADVVRFVLTATTDKCFARIFEEALATNLENQQELEERNLFKLFPDHEIGVAQGSALSALAGNIVLQEFDKAMNARGIMCVRYIDDFILLGDSQRKVHAAYESARAMLNRMGMDVYETTNLQARNDGKVDEGNIYNGTDVLGYRVSGLSRQPSTAARKKFLEKLDAVVNDAKREMTAAASNANFSHLHCYHQSVALLHKIIWGWSQSFRHTTAKHVFTHLDREIDNRVRALQLEAQRVTGPGARRDNLRCRWRHGGKAGDTGYRQQCASSPGIACRVPEPRDPPSCALGDIRGESGSE